MATQTVNYQCPSCTGPLHYNSATGKLSCDYCGSEFAVDEIEALYAKKAAEAERNAAKEAQQPPQEEAWDTASAGTQWDDAEAAKLRTYVCTSCGAELICDETTAATACVYCGNPTVIPGKLSGALRPDYVLPFRLEKKDAIAALEKYYQKKALPPQILPHPQPDRKAAGRLRSLLALRRRIRGQRAAGRHPHPLLHNKRRGSDDHRALSARPRRALSLRAHPRRRLHQNA